MHMNRLFPVHVAQFDFDDGFQTRVRTRVNRYLESARASRDIAGSPTDVVDTSYFSGRSVLADAGLEELRDAILDAARQYLECFGAGDMPLAIEHSWINLFRPGMQESEHAHEGSVLSCSYYVDAPAGCGDFLVPDPIGARRIHRTFLGLSGRTSDGEASARFVPQPGRLVMFESWIPHAVLGNKSGDTRISIATNLKRR
jgi:uncharacterized protein (TIGR02466 family)